MSQAINSSSNSISLKNINIKNQNYDDIINKQKNKLNIDNCVNAGKIEEYSFNAKNETSAKDINTNTPEYSFVDAKALEEMGLLPSEINSIITGQTTLEEILHNIETSPDNTRRKEILESQYLKAYELDFNSMEKVQLEIKKIQEKLAELQSQRKEIDNREIDSIMNIVGRLKQGENLDDILKEPIAWKYTDENGNTLYVYEDPSFNSTQEHTYTPVTFEELYKDSELLKELKSVLTADQANIFSDKIIYRWEDNDKQIQYFEELSKKYEEITKNREENLENIDNEINDLIEKYQTYQYIYDKINHEVEYNMTYIDPYMIKEDFEENINFNSSCLDTLEKIKNGEIGTTAEDLYYSTEIKDKKQVADIMCALINGQITLSGGEIIQNNSTETIHISGDKFIFDYPDFLPFMTDSEKEVFNYIYNTEGGEAAYDYLNGIAKELDNRVVEDKQRKDTEWASEHEVLASIKSVFITPFEGIASFCESIGALTSGRDIRRKNIYSSGDVQRSVVANNIANEHGGFWSFIYQTGMSMADSAFNIGLITLSGGTSTIGTAMFSTATMGSRVYGSALNDALDRGMSDSRAVLFAWTSAVVESAMESYSAGHLLNLEKSLGKSVETITTKITSRIANPKLANIAAKTVHVFGGMISQGLCEGEEELSTEIFNTIFTEKFIAGDFNNYLTTVNQYMQYGYSEDDAVKMAMKDYSNQFMQAFLGGFVSGMTFGAFGSLNSSQKVSNKVAKNIINEYNTKQIQLENNTDIANMKFKKEILDNIVAELGEEQGKKLLRQYSLYSQIGNTNAVNNIINQLPSKFRDQISSITANDIKEYLNIPSINIGMQFFGSKDAQIDAYVSQILQGINAMDDKYGSGSALYAIKRYIDGTATAVNISSAGNLRQIVTSLDMKTLKKCYNRIVSGQNQLNASKQYINSGQYSVSETPFEKIQKVFKSKVDLRSKLEAAVYFGDRKQYLYYKLEELAKTYPNSEYSQYFYYLRNMRSSDISEIDLYNYLSQRGLLDKKDYKALEKIDSMDKPNYSKTEKLAIFLYTKWLGPIITARNREAKTFYQIEIDGTDLNKIQDDLNYGVEKYNKIYNTNVPYISYDQFVYIMDNIISKNTLKEDIVVYRGVDKFFFNGTELSMLEPGTIINDKAFLSTSVVKECAHEHQYLLKITVPKGTPIAYLESFTGVNNFGQQELLLGRDLDLKIIKRGWNDETGKIEISAVVIPKQNQMIGSNPIFTRFSKC